MANLLGFIVVVIILALVLFSFWDEMKKLFNQLKAQAVQLKEKIFSKAETAPETPAVDLPEAAPVMPEPAAAPTSMPKMLELWKTRLSKAVPRDRVELDDDFGALNELIQRQLVANVGLREKEEAYKIHVVQLRRYGMDQEARADGFKDEAQKIEAENLRLKTELQAAKDQATRAESQRDGVTKKLNVARAALTIAKVDIPPDAM